MIDFDFVPCEDCIECKYYWENCDTGYECEGDFKKCHEFILATTKYKEEE